MQNRRYLLDTSPFISVFDAATFTLSDTFQCDTMKLLFSIVSLISVGNTEQGNFPPQRTRELERMVKNGIIGNEEDTLIVFAASVEWYMTVYSIVLQMELKGRVIPIAWHGNCIIVEVV